MIPQTAITAWRNVAPWASADQVEQDLILSRAICELYQHPQIRENLVFRGGTGKPGIFNLILFSNQGQHIKMFSGVDFNFNFSCDNRF